MGLTERQSELEKRVGILCSKIDMITTCLLENLTWVSGDFQERLLELDL